METLSGLPVCIASLGDNQSQQVDRIRSFAVSEISRQNLLANASKLACERKLARLQTALDQVCHAQFTPPARRTRQDGPVCVVSDVAM